MDETKELTLDVLVREDKAHNVLVAQCLQHDISVQAPTETKLMRRFAEALCAYLINDVKERRAPLSSVPQAPPKFWEMVYGVRAVDSMPIFVPAEAKTNVRAVIRRVPAETCA